MKTKIIAYFLTMWVGVALIPLLAAAEKTTNDNVQSVFIQKGAVLTIIDGKPVEATNEVKFPKDIVINTNGMFTVAGGKERSLGEGQVLTRDGMLTSPDGSVVPVEDH